ncbi:MAG: RNase P subunit p30 family protein [Candidatus Thorarchaeota archaeon]
MSYFESRLPVDINNIDEIEDKLKFCKELGIKNIILEPINEIYKIPSDIRDKVEKTININIYFRINLKLKTIEEFRKKIINFNNFQDILSIESLNRDVQLNCSKDSRVDIISFSDPDIIKTLTPGVISLTKQNNSFVEFSLAPIMVNNKTIQSKNFRNLYKFTQLALRLKANYIFSGNFINLFDYRHPRTLISVCHSLLEIPISTVKKAYITNPKMLIEKTKIRHNNKLK